MQYKHDNTILFIGLVVFIMFFVVFRFMNKSVEDQLKNQISHKKQIPHKEEPLLPQDPIVYSYSVEVDTKHALNPSDPAQYHIREQTESLILHNQRYWDSTMRKILQDSDVLDRMVETEAFKGTKKTSRQFRKQMIQIDGRIEEYQRRVQEDPGNDSLQQKLQNLYRMKSIAGSLEEVVVEK